MAQLISGTSRETHGREFSPGERRCSASSGGLRAPAQRPAAALKHCSLSPWRGFTSMRRAAAAAEDRCGRQEIWRRSRVGSISAGPAVVMKQRTLR